MKKYHSRPPPRESPRYTISNPLVVGGIVQRPIPSRSLGTSGTTPPWCEHEERRNRVGRERSETPQGRNTRTRTETRSSAGGHSTNTGRSQRERPINVPEPPAPPTRMSGTQWLSSGYPNVPEPPSSSTSNRSRGPGYFQPPYWRTNPRTHVIEYAQGYYAPYNRWMLRSDGVWIDLLPQTPDQSIFFHQPSAQRRRNELYLYGYLFSMGLYFFLNQRAGLRPASQINFLCLRTTTFHSRVQAERFLYKKSTACFHAKKICVCL